MKVTIFGSGYVGLVTGACLADIGHEVVCIDVNADRIAKLKQGEVPIFEPGLEALVKDNVQAGRLSFTTDIDEAVAHGLFQMIAVGTPPGEDGSADLQYVLQVANSIGKRMQDYKVVVCKSTVPVGTSEQVRAEILKQLAARQSQVQFDVASNPEFLKEGAAVKDFNKPDRIVIGVDSDAAKQYLIELYQPFNRNHERVMTMDIASAELTKYAANAMLATKISFMNELSNISDKVGADIEQVRLGIGADQRIGYHFIYPGCGYGGSCFPKDVKALAATAKQMGVDATLLNSVTSVNDNQKNILFQKVNEYFEGNLNGKKIALWGLAFKPGTDDMREAPSRVLMEALWAAGSKVCAYDPKAAAETAHLYSNEVKSGQLLFANEPYEATEQADALVIATEWKVFRAPDFKRLQTQLHAAAIIDGRNMYDPAHVAQFGLSYLCVGRPAIKNADAKPLHQVA